jgi:hypothetical protein
MREAFGKDLIMLNLATFLKIICKTKFFTQKSEKQASLRLSGEYFRLSHGIFFEWTPLFLI